MVHTVTFLLLGDNCRDSFVVDWQKGTVRVICHLVHVHE